MGQGIPARHVPAGLASDRRVAAQKKCAEVHKELAWPEGRWGTQSAA